MRDPSASNASRRCIREKASLSHEPAHTRTRTRTPAGLATEGREGQKRHGRQGKGQEEEVSLAAAMRPRQAGASLAASLAAWPCRRVTCVRRLGRTRAMGVGTDRC